MHEGGGNDKRQDALSGSTCSESAPTTPGKEAARERPRPNLDKDGDCAVAGDGVFSDVPHGDPSRCMHGPVHGAAASAGVRVMRVSSEGNVRGKAG